MNKGFTLIESLIYLGLFAIIMTGIIATAYAIFETNGRNQTKNLIQEDGDFLLSKVNWALTGTTAVSVVASPAKLTLTRANSPTTVVFDLNGNYLEMKRGSTGVNLNNSNITVSGLNFTDVGSGTSVESVTVTFTLTAVTPNGVSYIQNFQTTKDIRK